MVCSNAKIIMVLCAVMVLYVLCVFRNVLDVPRMSVDVGRKAFHTEITISRKIIFFTIYSYLKVRQRPYDLHENTYLGKRVVWV